MSGPERHLDDEQLQRLLHGEADPLGEAALRGHLAGCAECRARFDLAAGEEERVREALRRLDHPAVPVSVRDVLARARRREPRPGRWAAAILVALAAGGVAYAAPGSPVRDWVHAVIGREAPAPPPAATDPAPSRGETTGVSIDPGERLTIVFAGERPGRPLAVVLVDGTEVAVRAIGGAANFTSDVDRLTVGSTDSDVRFEVDVPHAAPWVEIRGADRRLLLKDGRSIVADVPPDDRGRYLLPLEPAS